MRTVTDADRARMRAEAEAMHAARAEHTEVLMRGALRQLGVGGYVALRRDAVVPPDVPCRSGVVIDVVDSEDRETGERRRSYAVLHPGTLARHVIAEDDVERETVRVAASSEVVTLIRRICREVHHPTGSRAPASGVFRPEHRRLIVEAFRLLEAV